MKRLEQKQERKFNIMKIVYFLAVSALCFFLWYCTIFKLQGNAQAWVGISSFVFTLTGMIYGGYCLFENK